MIPKECLEKLQSDFSAKQYECLFGLATGLSLGDIAQSLETSTTNASAIIAGIGKKLGISPRAEQTVIEQLRIWVKDYIKNFEETVDTKQEPTEEKLIKTACETIKEHKEKIAAVPDEEITAIEYAEPMTLRYCIEKIEGVLSAETDKLYHKLGKTVVENFQSNDCGINTAPIIEKAKNYKAALEVLNEIGTI